MSDCLGMVYHVQKIQGKLDKAQRKRDKRGSNTCKEVNGCVPQESVVDKVSKAR